MKSIHLMEDGTARDFMTVVMEWKMFRILRIGLNWQQNGLYSKDGNVSRRCFPSFINVNSIRQIYGKNLRFKDTIIALWHNPLKLNPFSSAVVCAYIRLYPQIDFTEFT